MRTKPFLLLAALGGVALTQGCVALGAVGAASVGVVALQDRTMGEGLDDALASNTLKTRLMAADGSGFSHVDVEVADGRLLLSGYAPSQQHKDAAELIARNVRGINEIYNEIEIGGHDGFMRSAQDEMITAQVRTRLVASPNVRGLNVNIETHRGTVYLMGVAHSQAELQRAAEITSVVPGVRRVVSLMSVRAPGPVLEQANVGVQPHAEASSAPY